MTVARNGGTGRRRGRRFAALGAVLVASALTLLPATAASAHDYLVDSSPASGAVQTEPLTQVSLTFNDRVLDLTGNGSSAILQVTAGGRYFETGCPSVLGDSVTAPVALGAAGAYTVDWQIVSADGHTVSGTYGFEYKPAAGATSASAGSASPTCGAPSTPGSEKTPAPEATPGAALPTPGETVSTSAPASASSSADSGLPLVIGIGIAIVVLALIGVVIVVLTARRKPPQPPAPGGD
ncbi:copper resistance CopC family protein [uncultured Leifsonia sp.]|uniref:copper resistance CopC family protein n=1 Tax=uncultured Leifsonia sp. TaxID=340359 RepID=UPI0025CEBFD3|nr:copper resistance CopC family protein [uncultured Leifsonia sp.]